jgi:hypothetical protein
LSTVSFNTIKEISRKKSAILPNYKAEKGINSDLNQRGCRKEIEMRAVGESGSRYRLLAKVGKEFAERRAGV